MKKPHYLAGIMLILTVAFATFQLFSTDRTFAVRPDSLRPEPPVSQTEDIDGPVAGQYLVNKRTISKDMIRSTTTTASITERSQNTTSETQRFVKPERKLLANDPEQTTVISHATRLSSDNTTFDGAKPDDFFVPRPTPISNQDFSGAPTFSEASNAPQLSSSISEENRQDYFGPGTGEQDPGLYVPGPGENEQQFFQIVQGESEPDYGVLASDEIGRNVFYSESDQ